MRENPMRVLGSQFFWMALISVPAARITECRHARSDGSFNAKRRILDHHATRRINAHFVGGKQEQVWRKLAALHHAGRIDRIAEIVADAGLFQAERYALGL